MSNDLFEDPRLAILFQKHWKEYEELGLPEHAIVEFVQRQLRSFDGGMSQGARAGRSGGYLEERIQAGFKKFGVRTVKDNPEYHHVNIFQRRERFLIERPCINGKIPDFVYIDFWRSLKVAIECKQQITSGSTDRKIPYEIDDLLTLPIQGFWIAISGDGFSPKVLHKVQNKIVAHNNRPGMKGRLVHDNILFRAIESLVERGEII